MKATDILVGRKYADLDGTVRAVTSERNGPRGKQFVWRVVESHTAGVRDGSTGRWSAVAFAAYAMRAVAYSCAECPATFLDSFEYDPHVKAHRDADPEAPPF